MHLLPEGVKQPGSKEEEMVPVAIILAVLVTFEILAHRFGADSRDGVDWSARPPWATWR